MGKSTPLFVGLDVHKESIAVAHAEGGRADQPGRSQPGMAAGGQRPETRG